MLCSRRRLLYSRRNHTKVHTPKSYSGAHSSVVPGLFCFFYICVHRKLFLNVFCDHGLDFKGLRDSSRDTSLL